MTKKKSKLILKNPMDFTLLITVFILLGLGIITVLSASSPTALSESGNSYKYVEKQGFAGMERQSSPKASAREGSQTGGKIIHGAPFGKVLQTLH